MFGKTIPTKIIFFQKQKTQTKIGFVNFKVLKKKIITELKNSDSKYKNLDNSVLFAIVASRKAVEKTAWNSQNFGINIGSSRGATALFEKHHQNFLETGKANTLASPTTTLGNISS